MTDIIWEKGDDYLGDDAELKTFGITRHDPDPHINIIEVYEDEELRDEILAFLCE